MRNDKTSANKYRNNISYLLEPTNNDKKRNKEKVYPMYHRIIRKCDPKYFLIHISAKRGLPQFVNENA